MENGRERSLKGANVVFFGGGSGIGRATAQAIAQRGASVLIVGRKSPEDMDASMEFLAGDLSTIAGIKETATRVKAWRPELHGVMHTAMTSFQGRTYTADGLEFAFALQYFARAALNRLLIEELSASGDGRVVHIGGDVEKMVKVDLDDLQWKQRKFSFMQAILGTHLLGQLHIMEAQRRWADRPVSFAQSCVGTTKTKAMLDPGMPWYMRLMGRFGTSPEASARNAISLLTTADAAPMKGAILRKPKVFAPEPIALSHTDADRLWTITTELASARGLTLSD